MSFDGIFTHAMVDELRYALNNGRVSKVHQPYKNEIILVIRANGKNHKLLLSAHPSYARIQLTEIPYENPSSPPNFCMVMRKHLEGAVLEDIQQVGNDRIIHFTFKSRDELGDVQNMMLIVELMGRHSNLFLVEQDTQRIMDTIKHVPVSQNTYRAVMPGATYVTPPHQDKLNPFETTNSALIEVLENPVDLPLAKKFQQAYQGLGSDTANELVYRSEEQLDKFPEVVHSFIETIRLGKTAPTLTQVKKKTFFTPVPYLSLNGESESYPTLSTLLDHYYQSKAEKDRVQQQGADLIHVVQTELQRNMKKLKKLEKTMAETELADDYRIRGEVLTAYLHELHKGQTEATLANFYDEDRPMTIALNPRSTPSQNAQKYFSKYQKLKNAIIFVTEQIRLTNEEIDYLDSVSTQLELATPKDIAEIKEELIQQGYLKKKTKKKQKRQKASAPDKYVSSDGDSILVGKNNLQNDQLTLKTARKSDIWLHTKNIPGSHVIIQSNDPSETTILEAANIAAYFSKSQLSASVPVDLVEVKKIRKPNGAKPGFVIYEGQRTVFVTPDKTLVDKLKV
ncbi:MULTISPECIES: NFACT RNA binding domain-containing protein [Carnobacterium]|uniref:Rqc2 homolog RqcH n=1 Tax=Carnobacterium antarcticum TaxID=2126436 RepID=A0ABW4NQN6_9LACT|nr:MULTISPECIES: NFACT RNA binding domain-containing protein [unclassified Carnobacterium]ALV21237.1 Fibronectin/fibrinogen-binding protein [Carnobacterium sp. CP1]QQP69263.1 NFACT family protein [Carnobacterium sp. CS13]